MYEEIFALLQNQKRRLLKLDGAEPEGTGNWLTEREQQGIDFVAHARQLNENDDRKKLFAGGSDRPIGLMEILYDNTVNWLMSQANKSLSLEFLKLQTPGVISEDTTTSNIATFTTSLLPAVRRVFANLVGMDLVSVQPLAGPSGFIYWIDHRFESTHGADGISADDRVDEHQDAETYTDSSEKGTIRELYFKLTSKQVNTSSKKAAGTWTIEAEQDLQSQWNLDLEAELLPELANLITREINRTIVNALIAGVGSGDTEWNINTPAGDTSTSDKLAYYQTLWHAILTSDTLVFNNKFRNPDWLLMNASTYYYIARLNNFRGEPRITNQHAAVSTRYVGTLNDQYRVYIDPFMSDNKIIMGIRGDSWKNSVAVFAPYIPLFLSEKFVYSNDFSQFRQGCLTRFWAGVIPETSTQSPVSNAGLSSVTLTSS
jgi:hypothetical protein